jgi:hypothetical protein
MAMQLNADRTQTALMHGGKLEWIPSPQPGVERRMLERIGDEIALATSIVRYQPASQFPPHSHELGEEFVVLEGVFSDEYGDYSQGTYIRNPPRSSHAPYSKEGCVIFVKLRQMHADETEQVTIRPSTLQWRDIGDSTEVAQLYAKCSEIVCYQRVPPGYESEWPASSQGEEIFVIDGSIQVHEASDTLERWSWLRHSPSQPIHIQSMTGALLWIKRGHLAK